MTKWIQAQGIDEITKIDLEIRERAERARDILTYKVWFDYTRAREIFGFLDTAYLSAERAFSNPRKYGEIRPLSFFVHGDKNAGKTTIMIRYENRCEGIAKSKGESWLDYWILYYEVPPRVTLKQMFSALLAKLGGPRIEGTRLRTTHTNYLVDEILKKLKAKQVRILIIDELQNMTRASGDDIKDIFISFKKFLNQGSTRIVLVGTNDAMELFEHSDWLEERLTPLELPIWEDGPEFRDMLRSIYDTYKLALPGWDLITFDERDKAVFDYEMVLTLLSLSEGRLGRLIQIIQYAAVRVLLDNRTTIRKADYEFVFNKKYYVEDVQIQIEDAEGGKQK